MGVTNPQHRNKLLAAVAELLVGGGTQVYILAAEMNWRILKEEEKRKMPKSLLTKMVRIMITKEKLNLSCFRITKNCLPLPLILASHRFSLQLSTHQQDVEAIIWEEWTKLHLSDSPNFSSLTKTKFSLQSSTIGPSFLSPLTSVDQEKKSSDNADYFLPYHLSRYID